tara:strand:- start:89 stop:529 length:441 start_codon:yes stop_codon:yes gene_type:complete
MPAIPQPPGLLGKKSLYDLNTKGILGNALGTPSNPGFSPKDNAYYGAETLSNDSPFDTSKGSGDHMVDLLTTQVITFTGNTYLPSPIGSNAAFPDAEATAIGGGHFADLNATFLGQHSNAVANAELGQFGGPYTLSGACTSGGGLC